MMQVSFGPDLQQLVALFDMGVAVGVVAVAVDIVVVVVRGEGEGEGGRRHH
jgi:NADH:ubiquinone oxidoreductase subunit K